MSRRRPLSAIYHEICALYGELAARVEEAERSIPTVSKTTHERKAPVIVRPEGESNDLDRARARRLMRAEGFTENDQ